MILPDVNVLLYALRTDAPQYDLCRGWLDGVVLGDRPFGISKLVLNGVVRIASGVRAFKDRTSLEDVFGFCQDLLNQPHCRAIEPGERHWEIFQRLCVETGTRGPMVTDAWFAALAIESGCEWITMDRDFARFPGLRWSIPEARDA